MRDKMYSNIIEMDIWSSFGCFSKPFSNSGGLLTYLIPPKTSIIGIIGAILGYSVDDYKLLENNSKKFKIEELFDIKISIQPLFDLKTKKIIFNYNYGNGLSNIKQDVLIKPYYKLFISFPNNLKNEERIFLNRIKSHKTVFSLYMGRNEFFLNYEFKNIFDYNSFVLTFNNSNDFFNGNPRIYGTINRSIVKETVLKSDKDISENVFEGVIYSDLKFTKRLKPFYEYIINEFPIKRENFVNFQFNKVSFYSARTFDECYFSNIVLKEGYSMELCKIGDNKWIYLI